MSTKTSPSDNVTGPLSDAGWLAIDQRLKRADEDRWVASRFAPEQNRRTLTALYALALELARVRTVVSEPGLGQIRFQWWREALAELEQGAAPRAHDVVSALAAESAAGRLRLAGVQKLVDGYEAAFEASDRAREPEAWLALLAASVLVPAHGWAEEIREVSAAYAAARRGGSKAFGPHVKAAPKSIRPAIAHFRLRKFYCEGKNPNGMTKRFSIMKAMQTGIV
jgi:Squalene/phytoene synthase